MKKAILTICVGELYWELARFVPYVIWRKKQEPDLDVIVMTREDRFDLYGEYTTRFIPISIEGDCYTKKAECFRLNGFSNQDYLNLLNQQYKLLMQEYEQVERVFPKLEKFANAGQFDRTQLSYDYRPRNENKVAIESLDFKKPIVVVAPRFRESISRNWIHWKSFFELLKTEKDFEFVLCGKDPEYIKDSELFDLGNVKQIENTSLIGYSIELIKKAVLTVGSQSAIPSLSLLLGTPVLQWGHNRINLMTDEYNPTKTKCTFMDDHKYSRSANDIFNELKKVLKG